MKSYAIYLAMLLLSGNFLAAVEIYQIKEVLKYINPSKRTLVVLDIDNTLLYPKNGYGLDHWIHYAMHQKVSVGLDRIIPAKQMLLLALHLMLNIEFVAIEETVTEDIACIQSKCERIFCLTARSAVTIDRTLTHLSNYSLVFEMPEVQEYTFNFATPSIYKSGVLACGQNSKGAALLAFLDAINYTPEAIVFVDDMQYNLDAVCEAAQERNIEYIGLRYAGVDHKQEARIDASKIEADLQEFFMKYPLRIEEYEGHRRNRYSNSLGY